MQSVSSRIWTRVTVSISYDDNRYTTGTSCTLNKETKVNQTKSIFYKKLFFLFTQPPARAGYDTRSIFKRSLTGLNSEFPFS